MSTSDDPKKMSGTELLLLAERIARRIRLRPSFVEHEDVRQDACEILLAQRYDPKDGVSERAWRYCDCLFKLKDRMKRLERGSSGELESQNLLPDHRDDLPATDARMDAPVYLKQLDPVVAEVVAMTYDGMTMVEIAAKLNVPYTTAYDRAKRGKRKINGQQ